MFGKTFSRALALAMMLVVALTSTTFGSDGLKADADNFVGTIPGGSNSGNSHSATQAAGTTVAYVFSALIDADNQVDNNVFAVAGDTVTVSITRSGDWLASGGTDFANFTAYDVQQTVPTWQSSTINCGQSATLQNISFSDAGVNDAPWTIDIDWGDVSTDFSTSVATRREVGHTGTP